jgi:phage shock protein PspC (stress-responsive transcriptional regulator)
MQRMFMRYAIGALLADLFRVTWAIGVIAGVTFLSGVVVYGVMWETLPRKRIEKAPTL